MHSYATSYVYLIKYSKFSLSLPLSPHCCMRWNSMMSETKRKKFIQYFSNAKIFILFALALEFVVALSIRFIFEINSVIMNESEGREFRTWMLFMYCWFGDKSFVVTFCWRHRSCHSVWQLMFVQLPTFAIACIKFTWIKDLRAQSVCGFCRHCKINYYPYYIFRPGIYLKFSSRQRQ